MLQKIIIWGAWLTAGSNPRVISTSKEGYKLSIMMNPHGHLSLLAQIPIPHEKLPEGGITLHSQIEKQAVEKVMVWFSLAFYIKLHLIPESSNDWQSILDLCTLNLYLKTKTFKMKLIRINKTLHTRREGYIAEFKRCIFPNP